MRAGLFKLDGISWLKKKGALEDWLWHELSKTAQLHQPVGRLVRALKKMLKEIQLNQTDVGDVPYGTSG